MVKVFLTNLGKYNEGELVGEWLELPVEEMKIKIAMGEIGINEEYEEYFITDYECEFNFQIGEYTNVYELNKQVEQLAEYDEDVVKALFEIYSDVDEVISILENETYTFYAGMALEDVAEEIIDECYELPEIAQRYFDYEAFARDLSYDGYTETETGVILID